jgi:glutaconate CoA-transferase subunit B
MLRQSLRTFVSELDYRTSSGGSVSTVVTDLGVLEPRGVDRELTLTAVHPGVEVEQAREATGWELRVADDLGVTHAPTEAELTALRALEVTGES